MTVNELKDYLAKYTGEGKGDALVLTCDKRDNPITDGMCIADAIFVEHKDGDCMVVLQTE